METFVFLETAAYLVIGILGFKLTASLLAHFFPKASIAQFLESERADIFTSIFTVAIFVIPLLSSLVFNFPERHKQLPQ